MTMRLLVASDLKPAGGIIGAGFDELRWPLPVRPGDELRVESEILEVRPLKSRADRGVVKVKTTTLNQRGEAGAGLRREPLRAASARGAMDRAIHEDYILVLQGGGALGAYQAGVFEALSTDGLAPNWVTGISIGAINCALIAGNAPERRVERLREFWNIVSSALPKSSFEAVGDYRAFLRRGRAADALFRRAGVLQAARAAGAAPAFRERRKRPATTTPRRCAARWRAWWNWTA